MALSSTSIQLCPHCEADGVTALRHSSREASVWYIRCLYCGHVWTLPKEQHPAPPAPFAES
jgi:hypothetical protein